MYCLWRLCRKNFLDAKMLVFTMVFAVVCWNYAVPLNAYLHDVNYPVNGCLMPFYFTNPFFIALFFFCILYVHSGIPFLQYSSMYQILRVGRRGWAAGQIVCIVLRSFLCVVILVICTLAPLIGKLEYTNDWGRVLRTIGMNRVLYEYNLPFRVCYELLDRYSAGEFLFLFMILLTLIASMLGILMYVIAIWVGRILAVGAAALLCMLSYCVMNLHPKIMYRMAALIPPVWVKAVCVATPDLGYYWLPSLSYMLCMLLILISVMSILILLRVKYLQLTFTREDV